MNPFSRFSLLAFPLALLVFLGGLLVDGHAATMMDINIALDNYKWALLLDPENPSDCEIYLNPVGNKPITAYEIVQTCGTGGKGVTRSTQTTEHFPNTHTAEWCETTFLTCSEPHTIVRVAGQSTIYGGGGYSEWGCVIGVGYWGWFRNEITTVDCLGRSTTKTVWDITQGTYYEPNCAHPAAVTENACKNYEEVLETIPLDPSDCNPPPLPPAPWERTIENMKFPCDCYPIAWRCFPTEESGVCDCVPIRGHVGNPLLPPPPDEGHLSNSGTYLSAPNLTSINPSAVIRGTYETEMTLTGTKFYSHSVARFNGVPLPTVYVSGSTLKATISTEKMLTLTTAEISVTTDAPARPTKPAETLASQKDIFTVKAPFLLDPIVQNGDEIILPIRWSLPVQGASIDCGTTPTQHRTGDPARCGFTTPSTFTFTGTHTNGAPNSGTIAIPARSVVVDRITTSIRGQNTDGITMVLDTPQPIEIRLHLTDDSGGQGTIRTTIDPSTLR